MRKRCTEPPGEWTEYGLPPFVSMKKQKNKNERKVHYVLAEQKEIEGAKEIEKHFNDQIFIQLKIFNNK